MSGYHTPNRCTESCSHGSTTETRCHCGAEFHGSDHCTECGCEQYESYCDHLHRTTGPFMRDAYSRPWQSTGPFLRRRAA